MTLEYFIEEFYELKFGILQWSSFGIYERILLIFSLCAMIVGLSKHRP